MHLNRFFVLNSFSYHQAKNVTIHCNYKTNHHLFFYSKKPVFPLENLFRTYRYVTPLAPFTLLYLHFSVLVPTFQYAPQIPFCFFEPQNQTICEAEAWMYRFQWNPCNRSVPNPRLFKMPSITDTIFTVINSNFSRHFFWQKQKHTIPADLTAEVSFRFLYIFLYKKPSKPFVKL